MNNSEAAATTKMSESVEDSGQPLRRCDIVMKGDITSGVVYPKAVGELAKSYRFMSIGGTSSGAIAAAAAAAAELRRFHRKDRSGFEMLEALPIDLGKAGDAKGNSMLFLLFQPQAITKPLFDTAVAFVGDNGPLWWLFVRKVVPAAVRSFPLAAGVGLITGIALIFLLLAGAVRAWAGWIVWPVAIVVLVVGLLLALIIAFVLRILKGLTRNYFGFCTGMPAASGKGAPALTSWLADYLDGLAGVTDPDQPLTFGDLRWGLGKRGDGSDPEKKPDPDKDPAIRLNMITSCLTLGRPYSLPFPVEQKSPFLFDPQEMRQFFPERIVRWMEDHPSVKEHENDPVIGGRRLIPVPPPDEMPVVVATRMSISFPILLCALPLYRVDFSLARNQEQKDEKVEVPFDPGICSDSQRLCAERCWFSDGGIAINFPINFFDRPLPRWVTFGVNVRAPHPDHPIDKKQSKNVWMPANNSQGILPPWQRFEQPDSNVGSLLGFLNSILDTARTWMDNTQMMSPGNRDRTVHVSVGEKEGGLNLTMPEEVITALGARGFEAGKLLVDHYATLPPPYVTSWDNHRWSRYRSTMALLEELFDSLELSFDFPPQWLGDRSYQELLERTQGTAPSGYAFDPLPAKQQVYAQEATEALLKLIQDWKALQELHRTSFSEGRLPHPHREIGIRPHF